MGRKRNPILITGSHRSGTTWVGQMLAAAPHVGYIHEPFNPEIKIGLSPKWIKQTFKYIDEENSEKFELWFENILRYKYPFKRNMGKVGSIGEANTVFGQQASFLFHKLRGDIPIIKDPIAFFSADWLAKRFNMEVLVMIRHPAAFCSSLKIKNWNFNFNHFLNQPGLMERYLEKFRPEIQEYARTKKAVIDQAILLWNCIHHTVATYQENHPDWLFVKHKDLSLDPVDRFKAIYKNLELQFTPEAKRRIIRSTGAHNPVEQQQKNEFLRNSRANVQNWKKRLSRQEITRIREGTAETASLFYNEDEW